jgi:hypothetical protein
MSVETCFNGPNATNNTTPTGEIAKAKIDSKSAQENNFQTSGDLP